MLTQTLRKAGLGLFLVLITFGTILYTRAGGHMRAYAVPNTELNFQARLLNGSGAIVADSNAYSVEFNLYNVATGGTTQWTETQSGLTVKTGYLSVHLGTVTPFPSTIDWTQKQWLTMNVNGDGEMNPRLQLTAVPLALRSIQADGITNGASTLTANDLAQLAPGTPQVINSALAALRLNQTGAGALLQLQQNGTDTFTVASNGNLASSGSATFSGGTLNLGTASQLGGLVLYDGSSNTGTVRTAALGQNTVYTLPDPGSGSATVCISTGNCGGTGDISNGGNAFGAPVTIGTNDAQALNLETNNVTRLTLDTSGNANLTGTFTAGTGLIVTAGGINNNSGGITNAGSITGVGTNITAVAGLTIASTGANNLILNSGSGVAVLGATTLQTADDLSLDIAKATDTTLLVQNSGAGVANLNISDGALQIAGTTVLTNGRAAQNLTGITSSGAITFSGLGAGLVQSSSGGMLSSGAVDRNSATFFNTALAVANGGTGAGSFTANGVLFGDGTNALGVTAAGTTGQCLVATTSSAPSWGSCAGAGSGVTLQNAYTNGNTITTADAKDLSFTLANTTTDSNFLVNIATGSASKFAIQDNGTDVLRVTSSGTVINTGGLSILAGGANITGTVTLASLNSAGVVHTNGSGVLSTSAVVLGTDTSGSYVANLGTLTGLSVTGNSGAGSTPALSVLYGSGANNAAAGSNTFTCASGTGNLSGGGTVVTIGTSGTTCAAIDTVNNPTFSGLLTASKTGATAFAVTGAPINTATSSLIQIGSAIAGGNTATDGGTYLGLNAPSTGAGSTADFLNFQVNGASKLLVSNTGSIITGGTVQYASGTADTNALVCRNNAGQLAACSSGALGGTAFIQGGNTFAGTTAGDLGTNNNGALNFRTNNGTKLTLDTAGGLTFNQSSTLGVASAATANTITVQGGTATSGNNNGGGLVFQGGTPAGSGSYGAVALQTSGGRVGIGTASPGYTLDVQGNNTDTAINLLSGNNAKYSAISQGRAVALETTWGVANAAGAISNISTAGDIVLSGRTEDLILTVGNNTGALRITTGTADTEKVTILNNGNLGIGSTSPGAKLQVNTGADATLGLILRQNSVTQSGDLLQLQTTGGGYIGAIQSDGVLNLGPVTGTEQIAGTSTLGDKIALYTNATFGRYGFGVQSGSLVAHIGTSSAAFAVRVDPGGAAQASSNASGVFTVLGTGNGTFAGTLAVNGNALSSTSAAFTLLSTPTTVTAFGAATTLGLGTAAGTTTINGNTLTSTGLTFGGATGTVTTTSNGNLTLTPNGSGVLGLNTGSGGTATTNITTLQRTASGTYTIDLNDGAATTLRLTNSGAGVADLNIAEGGLQMAGTPVLTNGRALQNLTGFSNNGAFTTLGGTVNINASSNFAVNIGTGTTNGTITIGGSSAPLVIDSTNFDVTSGGALSGITGYTQASGNFVISGTGTFDTGTGAISLDGATTAASSLTVTGLTTLNGDVTFQTGDTFTFNGDAFTDFTSNGLIISSGALTLDVTTAGTVASTGSNSGLVTAADGLSLLRGCSNNQILKWSTTGPQWNCAADATGISDARLKKNIEEIDGDMLAKIREVRLVQFDYDCSHPGFSTMHCDTDHQPAGVLAQELAQIFPELVIEVNGYYQVRYDALGLYNLKAVGELADKVDNLSQAPGITPGNVNAAAISTNGTLRLNGTGQLQNINGLDLIGGGASVVGGINNNNGGISRAGQIDGATTINAGSVKLVATGTDNPLELKQGGDKVFTLFSNGALELRLDANNAFTIKKADGSDVFTINTSGGLVQIGSGTADDKAILLVLDSKNTVGDPTGVNGAQYYNASSDKFRCYQDGHWQDCLAASYTEYILNNLPQSWMQPDTEQEFPGKPRTFIDLSNAKQFRLVATINHTGVSATKCRLQYALGDSGPWADLTTATEAGAMPFDSSGTVKGNWYDVVSDARKDIMVRIMCRGANHVTTNNIGSVRAQVR